MLIIYRNKFGKSLSGIIVICSSGRYGERLLRLEELSLASIKEMVEYWKSFEGKPFNPQQSIHNLVGKIITSLVNTSSNVRYYF